MPQVRTADQAEVDRVVRARRQRVLWTVLGAALLLTAFNAVKPLHIDDPFSHRIAEQIVGQPTDPYGFDILWVQWPQPVHEELTPPVVPYWWAAGLALFGDSELAWKLWMFPFALLLAMSLYALFRRFASGLEAPLTWMTVLSPAFLPAFNLMQDVPVTALGLSALALFLHAADRSSVAVAGLAGLTAGLAIQTKYTAVAMLAIMALHALLRRRLRVAGVAIGVALAVFAGWEWLMTLKYGQGMFFGQLGMPLWNMARSAMVLPLARLVGGAAPMVVVLGVAALGLPRSAVLGLAAAVVSSYALLFVFPVHDVLYTALGALAAITLSAVAMRLTRVGWGTPKSPGSARWVDWFLVGWLVAEVVLYFMSAPFPAVRRVMGVIVAGTFVAGRLAALRVRLRAGSIPVTVVASLSVALGFLFWIVDVREAMVFRDAPRAALQAIREVDRDARVWYVGHWGFQHYAEAVGLEPVVPDVSRLDAGDWIVIPDRVHQQRILLPATVVDRRERIELSDGIPLWTAQGYYGGDTPLRHQPGARLGLTLVRLRQDTVPPSAWSPLELLRWARHAPSETGAAATPALRRLLKARAATTRAIAAEGLAAIGPLAAAAVEDLSLALLDPEPSIRSGAARALGEIGEPSAVASLRPLLDDPVAEVRQAVAASLERLSGS